MTTLCQFENSNEIGVFAKLTNAYCLVAIGGSENFYSVFESELADHIPVVHVSIAGTRIIGRMVVGNKHGLLLPHTTTDKELAHITNSLPKKVKVVRLEEKMSALGNVIVCNDHVALIHPDIDESTEDIIAKTLKVEVFRQTIAKQALVGTYCCLTNAGALVHPKTTRAEQKELSSLLAVNVAAGTVNRGSSVIAGGLVVNDWTAFCGHTTTSTELSVIEKVFNLEDEEEVEIVDEIRASLIDELA